MSEPKCLICGDIGLVEVEGCTCGGIDIGVGVMHEPICGLEPCECGRWYYLTPDEANTAFDRCRHRCRAMRIKMRKTPENADPNEVWFAACERAKRHVAISHFELRREVAIEMALELLGVAHRLHGVACPACNGQGQRGYASTSTWRGGTGGSSLDDVCDECWGTRRTDRKGADLRALTGRKEDK